jgi:hypothetical protein
MCRRVGLIIAGYTNLLVAIIFISVGVVGFLETRNAPRDAWYLFSGPTLSFMAIGAGFGMPWQRWRTGACIGFICYYLWTTTPAGGLAPKGTPKTGVDLKQHPTSK